MVRRRAKIKTVNNPVENKREKRWVWSAITPVTTEEDAALLEEFLLDQRGHLGRLRRRRLLGRVVIIIARRDFLVRPSSRTHDHRHFDVRPKHNNSLATVHVAQERHR